MAKNDGDAVMDQLAQLNVDSDGETAVDACKEEATDTRPEPAQKQPQQRRGKKGKKQKWAPLDLNSLPAAPSNTANSQRSSQAPSGGSPWGKNNQYQQDAGFAHSARGGGGGWSGSNQSYGSQREEFTRRAADVPKTKEDMVALSRALVRLLRHGNPSDIPLDDEGYALISHIVAHRSFKRFDTSAREIKKLVDENDKKRYEIVFGTDREPYKIKATQGHSIKFKQMKLEPLTDPHKYPNIVHGTYLTNWRKIKKEGLKRFQRTHIHFAIGLIGETHVTSGMRFSSEIVIKLDLERALKDGLQFFESSNHVVLSEGDRNGVISPRYFKEVTKWDAREDKFKPIDFVFEG